MCAERERERERKGGGFPAGSAGVHVAEDRLLI